MSQRLRMGPSLTPRHRHLFLTGAPGCGKTTAIRAVARRLVDERVIEATDVAGFYTAEVRDSASGERVGFDVRDVAAQCGAAGPSAPLARLGSRRPAVGRYAVNVAAFENAVLPTLRKFLSASGDGASQPARLLVLDEVGKMELLAPDFGPLVTAALDAGSARRCVVFGTIPSPRCGRRPPPAVAAISARPDVLVLPLTKATRDDATLVAFQTAVKLLEGG